MESFRIHHDIRVQKANAISRYRRIQRITTLFRLAELLGFLLLLSTFSGQFAFSLDLSVEYVRRISVSLISPRSAFLIVNAIVVALFFASGGFSPKDLERAPDFYEEYLEKCRKSPPAIGKEERAKAIDTYRHNSKHGERKMQRCHSQNPERIVRREQLRRSVTEKPQRKGTHCGRRSAEGNGGVYTYAEDEMSSEEFRRTVEAFIARQQRFLREEQELPARVPVIET